VLDDIILGKAENINEATQMLHLLSGRTHHVYSAIALINNKEEKTDISISRVSFKPLTDHDIEKYCETKEPMGKAGAYAIQGKAAKFIERLDGSYSGVMGLPLYETWQLIQSMSK
jgi:septum formation protein